jgi:hypothetical protein
VRLTFNVAFPQGGRGRCLDRPEAERLVKRPESVESVEPGTPDRIDRLSQAQDD